MQTSWKRHKNIPTPNIFFHPRSKWKLIRQILFFFGWHCCDALNPFKLWDSTKYGIVFFFFFISSLPSLFSLRIDNLEWEWKAENKIPRIMLPSIILVIELSICRYWQETIREIEDQCSQCQMMHDNFGHNDNNNDYGDKNNNSNNTNE